MIKSQRLYQIVDNQTQTHAKNYDRKMLAAFLSSL